MGELETQREAGRSGEAGFEWLLMQRDADYVRGLWMIDKPREMKISG